MEQRQCQHRGVRKNNVGSSGKKVEPDSTFLRLFNKKAVWLLSHHCCFKRLNNCCHVNRIVKHCLRLFYTSVQCFSVINLNWTSWNLKQFAPTYTFLCFVLTQGCIWSLQTSEYNAGFCAERKHLSCPLPCPLFQGLSATQWCTTAAKTQTQPLACCSTVNVKLLRILGSIRESSPQAV